MVRSAAEVREWVRRKVTAMEGFADQVLIDMVCRRVAGQQAGFDRALLEADLRLLMDERAADFALALSDFIGAHAAELACGTDKTHATHVADAAQMLSDIGLDTTRPKEAVQSTLTSPRADTLHRTDETNSGCAASSSTCCNGVVTNLCNQDTDCQRGTSSSGSKETDLHYRTGPCYLSGVEAISRGCSNARAISSSCVLNGTQHLGIPDAALTRLPPVGLISVNEASPPATSRHLAADAPVSVSDAWLEEAILPLSVKPCATTSGVTIFGSAVCAAISDFEPPAATAHATLACPTLSAEDTRQLHEWLDEAARRLYGERRAPEIVARVSLILANRQLSSTVFQAVEASAEQGGWPQSLEEVSMDEAHEARPERRDGSAEHICRLEGQSGVFRALSQLPASHRSLLDAQTLGFIGQLWRALKVDEPHTAAALLEPPPLQSEPNSPPAMPIPPLYNLFTSSTMSHEVTRICESANGSTMALDNYGGAPSVGCVWDMASVRRWMEERVLRLQGFADQVVVDAISRRLEAHTPAHSLPKHRLGSQWPLRSRGTVDRATAEMELQSAAAAAAAELDVPSLISYAALFLESGANAFVYDLVEFLSSAAAAASPSATPFGLHGDLSGDATARSMASGLPKGVVEWCDPSRINGRVFFVSSVADGALVVTRTAARDGRAYFLRAEAGHVARLPRLLPCTLHDLRNVWRAPNGALLRLGDALVLLHASGTMSPVVDAPLHTRELDAAWPEDGSLSLAALVATPSKPSSPVVWPSSPDVVELRRFTAITGWQRICEVDPKADRLTLSYGGQHCGWRVRAGEHGHGSEFFVTELRQNAQPKAVTEGAGQCQAIQISPDGSAIAYTATHARLRDATGGPSGAFGVNAMPSSLWWVPWDSGMPPVKLSPVGASVLAFGWPPPDRGGQAEPEERPSSRRRLGEGSEVSSNSEEDREAYTSTSRMRMWMTVVRGGQARTWFVNLEGIILSQLELPVAIGGSPSWLPDGRCVQLTESIERLPSLWDGTALTPLPQPDGANGIIAAMLPLRRPDGCPLPAVLYSTRETQHGSPLVIHVLCPRVDGAVLALHSGALELPAAGCAGLSDGFGACGLGFTVQALLACGYRVLAITTRSFNATGYAQHARSGRSCEIDTNDGASESRPHPVVDVLAAADQLRDSASAIGLLASGDGAHVALRALCSSHGFNTAALAGCYVCPRLRDLELGRIDGSDSATSTHARLDQPPALLQEIRGMTASLILFHGEQDAECPVSHSRMIFHAARAASLNACLVCYPGQGNDFHSEVELRDVAERTCSWFLEHMPIHIHGTRSSS